MSTAVATGVWLYDPPHRRRVRADLFLAGRQPVVVAAEGPPLGIDWEWDVPPPDLTDPISKAVVLGQSPRSFWERRGVFIPVTAAFSPFLADAMRKHLEANE